MTPRRSSAACCVGWLLWLKGWVAAKTATTLIHALLLWGFRPWSGSFVGYYNVKQRIPSPSKWQVQKMLLVLRNVAMLTFSVTSPICMHISWGPERLNKHSLSLSPMDDIEGEIESTPERRRRTTCKSLSVVELGSPKKSTPSTPICRIRLEFAVSPTLKKIVWIIINRQKHSCGFTIIFHMPLYPKSFFQKFFVTFSSRWGSYPGLPSYFSSWQIHPRSCPESTHLPTPQTKRSPYQTSFS